MATDISKVGNVVQITEGEAQPRAFVGSNANYSFNEAGTILNISFGGTNTYAIDFEDLTIGEVAPADTDAAYTALSTVFPSEGGGSGTTPDLDEVLAEGGSLTANRDFGLGEFTWGMGGEGGGLAISMEDVVVFSPTQFYGRTTGIPLLADDFADDAAAAIGGIAVGGAYHNAGAVRIRLA